MEKKKMFLVAIVVMLTSQLYINFFVDDFRISTSVIIFSIFLILYENVNTINISITTSLIVFVFRCFLLYIHSNNFVYAVHTHYPVIVYYLVYGILFNFLYKKFNKNMIRTFLIIFSCDVISNISEITVRLGTVINKDYIEVLEVLMLVALVRAMIAMIVVFTLKYYKLLVVKENHEKRYRRLVMLFSELKSEMYFMKKNIDYIEKVMNNSYKLYEKMSNSNNEPELKNLSLSIAKDIHEVKKGYMTVKRGLDEIIVDKMNYTKMSFKDIMYMLEENTKKLLHSDKKHVLLSFKSNDNFFTEKHYELMSVLRNLINNSVESINKERVDGVIRFKHYTEDNNHVFEISDNGCGIKEKNIEYIFDPGFSTKFDNNTGFINRGIGLTLVYDLVINYFKGSVNVESEYGRNTKFIVLIPKISLEGEKE